MPRCTLSSIARAADVSVSTVSYAFRGDPKIPAATVQKIMRIAEGLGYRPNPAVSTLMAHIRSARAPKAHEKIAFIWVDDKLKGENAAYNQECLRGARQRAEDLGYKLEEFHLTAPGMTAMRMSNILRARGITGVIFSSCERQSGVSLDMNWDAHSMAIIGNARWNPELHRAGHYHYMGMRRVMLELAMRGYARPLALITQSVNERANRSVEAAFLAFHPRPALARRMLFPIQAFNVAEALRLQQKHDADALIFTYARESAAVRKLSRERSVDLGLASTQLEETDSGIAGIMPNHAQVAANAVDLVLGQLYRNERGVPDSPKELLFDGHWVEGETLRPRQVQSLPGVTL